MKTAPTNVHPLERVGSATLGGALLLQNFKHPSPIKTVLAIDLLYRGISGNSLLYRALGLNTTGEGELQTVTIEGTRVVTIGRPAEEIYQLWRNPRTLSRLVENIAEVTELDRERLHWSMHVPPGLGAEWDASLLEDRPGELLRWKSLEGTRVPNEGSLRFQSASGDRGTEVTLHFHFDLPGGALGSFVVKRLDFLPRLAAGKVLRRLKSLAETGEIPTLAHNPSARLSAQPREQPRSFTRTPSHMAIQVHEGG